MIGTQKLYKPPQTDRYEFIKQRTEHGMIYGVYRVFSDGSASEADYWWDRSIAKTYLDYKNKHLGLNSVDKS